MNIQRGDIYWIDFNSSKGSEINKIRPGLIMSANSINKIRRTVIVIPISSSPKPEPPITIPVYSNDKNAVAVIDQIRAIEKKRLREPIGTITQSEMNMVEDALRTVLELPQ